ncbi:mitochondrial export translocase Oxa1 [Phaeosphaeriaceae sp. PMI808]|nr:mitochondrial export translocase Oxa1 [Phaeosphaeriaceae sp. PMI808]
MLPSRGLRPAQFVPLNLRKSTILRSSVSRKFSSLPRNAGYSVPSCRANPLQSAQWRTGVIGNSNIGLSVSSVRYGSWYAPWGWGKSSKPTGDVAVSELSNEAIAEHIEPIVTSATPELAPAGIDKAPVVNSTSETAGATLNHLDQPTIDDLLQIDPASGYVDPTALIDHVGQLKELGLEYGWGMTSIMERTIEEIYLNFGLGWAGSIMVAAVAVRCATFFFQALSSDKMAGLAALKPLTAPLQAKIDEAVARGDKHQENLLKIQQGYIMKPHMGGFFSMGGFMVVQAWIGFSAFRLLRAMAELPVPGMAHDGFLWFTDLTVRDPYYILPLTTTAVFYTIFKTGGETGINNDVGSQKAVRQKLMTGMAIFMGIITAFQASGLQIYFLFSGILGAGTGYLLRQNGFRRLIRIRTIPSPQSNEMYSKVVSGEVTLKQIKGKDGKVRYQAPRTPARPTNRRNTTTLSGINIKPGTYIPAHLKVETPVIDTKRPDRDIDFEQGPQGSMGQKLDYYRRNYRFAFMRRRIADSLSGTARRLGFAGPKTSPEQERRKQAAERYEIERRRRFENRK